MKRLNAGQWFEVVFWAAFGLLAFGLSFQFDREISMYKFGAAGWPRTVIAVIVLASVGQFISDLRQRQKEDDKAPVEASYFGKLAAEHGSEFFVRMGITLALPLSYAGLLNLTGYYFTTPVFLAAYLYMTGITRIKPLIIVPAVIWGVLTVLFTRFLYVGLPVGYWPGFYDFSNWLVVLIRY